MIMYMDTFLITYQQPKVFHIKTLHHKLCGSLVTWNTARVLFEQADIN